jgi:hypothetical protein
MEQIAPTAKKWSFLHILVLWILGCRDFGFFTFLGMSAFSEYLVILGFENIA